MAFWGKISPGSTDGALLRTEGTSENVFAKSMRDIKHTDIHTGSSGASVRDVSALNKPISRDLQMPHGLAVKDGGGSYRDVRRYVVENGLMDREVHHMPADSVSKLDRDLGPCIEMSKFDHRRTASYGISEDAQAYRAKQRELINSGKFAEAQKMDIADLHSKFGDKYDAQIDEMKKYTVLLKSEGKI